MGATSRQIGLDPENIIEGLTIAAVLWHANGLNYTSATIFAFCITRLLVVVQDSGELFEWRNSEFPSAEDALRLAYNLVSAGE